MPKKPKAARPVSGRDQASTYRLGKETRRRLQALRSVLRDQLGRPLSETDVLRLAVQRLAEAELGPGDGFSQTPSS